MPSIIPGYMYSLFAALIVGSIVIYACSVGALAIQQSAEKQQLHNLDEYVAAQSLSLLSKVTQENQNATQYLTLPAQVGNQRYWVNLVNDSSGAWVESGFGTEVNPTSMHVELPAEVAASGSFVSGSGWPMLTCYFENQTTILTLTVGD